MCHRYIQEFGGYTVPVENLLIVKVCPMELKFFLETVFSTRISKVECFLWGHSNENLNHRENTTTENTFVHIAFQLKHGLRHIHTTTFQFYVNNGHTVNEQHYITTTVTCQWVSCTETRLTHNLVTALTCTDFSGVKYL